jgi:transcriptional regulator with XRE-family HTH domain
LTRKLVHPDVAARIALIRGRLGLKRYEFAERLGVTRATQGNWEMGQMPRADLLDKLARSGGVSVEWLLHGRDSGRKRAARPRASKNVSQKKSLCWEEPPDSFVLADFAPADLRKLPRRYLERYQSRATNLLIHLCRELKQYRTALKLEFRAKYPRAKRIKRRVRQKTG